MKETSFRIEKNDRFSCSSNYELYLAFSWIFVFISVDRWIKVEWPTRSQTICTRKRFIYLCLCTLILSLIENILYTFLCLNNQCQQKNLACEIFIHTIYITIYMTIPIALILISISRTCLITLHIKKRFRPASQQPLLANHLRKPSKLDVPKHLNTINTTIVLPCRSASHVPSSSATTILLNLPNHQQPINSPNRLINYSPHLRRRRSRLDTQMVILISINVAPFIIVHIITEIAYLFEKYSPLVARSRMAQLFIILIYLSWYLISATRFYTNCLLSRIYREEFKKRLYLLRHGCKPGIIIGRRVPPRRHSSRPKLGSLANGMESTITPAAHT